MRLEELSESGTKAEHDLRIGESFKYYKRSIFWSVVVSTTIIMDGFDGALIGGLFAQPAFKNDFGEKLPDGTSSIPALWQTILGMGAPLGRILGGLIAAYFADKFGRKKTLIFSLLLISSLLFLVFFAYDLFMMSVGLILSGIMWGVFNTLAPTYVSEVCPLALRGVMTAYINLCWVVGQMIAQGVMLVLAENETKWAYRIPFGLQWTWPALILVFLPFAPESPWWLVRKGRISEARLSLEKLISKDIDEILALIVITDYRERKNDDTSIFNCLKGSDLYRTEIACMAWSIQALSGNCIIGYAAYFFERAGLTTRYAFVFAFLLSSIGFLGTVISWFLTELFGRRSNYLYGLMLLMMIHFIIGVMDLLKDGNEIYHWVQAISLLIWAFVYDVTIGPVCYVVVSETSSTRLKEKTLSLATVAYSFWGVLFQVATPYMLNPSELDLGGKIGFVFTALCLLCFIWSFFRLPELKGRTYDEMTILFEKKISARKMREYNITEEDRRQIKLPD